MPIDSGVYFLDRLRQSRLLEPVQLDHFARDHAQDSGDVEALASDLLQRQWLTPFQLQTLLAGDARRLVLGAYCILERIGGGGMGEVFKARHRRLDRIAALKIIRADFLAHPDAAQRFLREARAAARLCHPNVVTIFDADQDGDIHYFSMEYVEGTDLSRWVKQSGPLPVSLACTFARQAALGLQHAHEHGLVHRDIKPSNLMAAARGSGQEAVLKILDFGLARFVSELPDDTSLTPEKLFLGTPDYIAPEQAQNSKKADTRADIFSLGCTLFYLLTGSPAFPGTSRVEKLASRLTGTATPVRSLCPQVPAQLEEVLNRMLAPDPADRFQVPAEVAAAIAAFLEVNHQAPTPPRATAAVPSTDPQELISTVGRAKAASTACPRPPALKKATRRKWVLLVTAAGICCLALTWLLVGLLGGDGGDRGEGNEPSNSPPRKLVDAKKITNSIGMKLILIPAGKFRMGSPPTEIGHTDGEGPQHEVRIPKAFSMGVYEVTQQEYQLVMGNNPSYFCARGGGRKKVAGGDTRRLPVDSVSWEDACEFCRRLTARPKEKAARRSYRLPTEAEWEYACRAGTTGPFHFGNSLSSVQANFNGKQPYGGAPESVVRQYTAPVGSFPANAFGLHDMHGNVWEWCQDNYLPYAQRLVPAPPGRETGYGRVLRGGGWNFRAVECRSANRAFREATSRSPYHGFRVVCEGKP